MTRGSEPAAGFEAPEGTPRPWGRPVTVGVLGGMGPYATLQFVRNVLELTPAEKDWHHVRMVVDNNCHIPSRTRSVLFDEASPLPGMIDSCRRLGRYPADVIALPCNSACHWLEGLRRAVKTPVLDIVSIASRALLARPGVRRVAALGGYVPYTVDLYGPHVAAAGGVYVKLDPESQESVAATIEAVKAAGRADEALRRSFQELVDGLAARHELDGVILACTEFSFFAADTFSVPVVDSSLALAQVVVDYAVHGEPLALDSDEVRRFWDERAALLERGEAGLLQATMLTATEEEAERRQEREEANLLRLVSPILAETETLLELGCGTGRWSRTLARHVGRVDAYDYSGRLVAVAARVAAEQGIDNVRFHQSAVETIPHGRQVDTVVSIALLHYLDEAQFRAAIALVRASVRPGGHAVFRETFGVDRRFELHGFYSEVLGTEYHAVYRTAAEIARQLGEEFELVLDEVTLPPTADKPETCQGVAVFRRSA